tara:strand:+ start:120 stop:719 length:600 start_codon:yes stop_codon:yes gene_type:complete
MSVEQTHNKFVKSLSDQGPLSKWIVEVYDYMKRVATSKNDHEYLFLVECMMVKACDPSDKMLSQDVVWNLYKWVESSRNYYIGEIDQTLNSDKWPKMSVEAVFSMMDKCKSINSHYSGDVKKERDVNYNDDDLVKKLSRNYNEIQEKEYSSMMGDSDSDYSIDVQDDDYDETSGEYACIHPGEDTSERKQASASLCGNE